MVNQNVQHKYLRLLFLWVGLWVFVSCSTAPHIYTMPPWEVENIRANLVTVGVVLVNDPPKTEVLMPAKGIWGGAKRGFVVGAALPVMVGFVSPIPGGTLLGAAVAPLTAVYGGAYGAANAVPAQEVEAAAMMLENVSNELRQMGLRWEFIDEVVQLGNDRTGLVFVALPDIGPQYPNKDVSYSHEDLGGVDTILEVKIEKTGLRGIYNIDPLTDIFIQTRVRLIRVEDNLVLMDETLYCMSDEDRTFKEWAAYKGQLFVDEFRSCVPELAEKIVDDFFLVYPMALH